ncbi:hypothetical protein Pfo_026396 [Paulownia fortunei]|nr:hypothetical protein Pfo_026396 [Paulownia fortunei]
MFAQTTVNSSRLTEMKCAEGLANLCNCYAACPEQGHTLAKTRHSDDDFITVLLQDNLGGLKVLHQNQWVDVPRVLGVNIGDLTQASVGCNTLPGSWFPQVQNFRASSY